MSHLVLCSPQKGWPLVGAGSQSHASPWLLCGATSGRELTPISPSSRFIPFLPSLWSLSAACGSGSRSSGATPVSGPPPPPASSTPAGQPTAINRLQMQLHLRGLQNSTNDLRSQLQQLRKLQVPPPLRGPAPSNPALPEPTYLPKLLPKSAPSRVPFTGLLSETFLELPSPR